MRNIQTFITHLLWDDGEPKTLRGSLRLVTKDEVLNFNNQEELIVLLHKMMSHPAEESPLVEIENGRN
jgi:hypothetical protein